MIDRQQKGLILSGNVYAFNLACELSWFRAFLNQADLIRLDGYGVRLGARLLGHELPRRMTWADFAWDLAAFAEQHHHTLYLLGGYEDVVHQAAERLKARHPGLSIVGVHHGYFDKRQGSEENNTVIAHINQVQPNILIVGFGMPLQEQWLKENWDNTNANVILTGGAVFDYVSGRLQRAPTWMTNHGLEWLGRLLIEPGRLWRRYLIGNPLFLTRIIAQRLGVRKF